MTVSVIGNKGKGTLGRGSDGIGRAGQPNGLGWLGLVARTAGDVYYVPLQDIANSDINQGIFFQSSAAAKVEFTLSNVAMATSTDPNDQASVLWGNLITLTPKDITPCLLLFTVAKITFTAPGEVYIGVR